MRSLCRLAAALGLILAAAAASAGVVRHWLWDANQRPLYQRCAADFEAAHPHIRIRIQQMGWDDYWMALSTGFVSGTAPDVITNHVSRYPEFVTNGVLLDLAPLVARDRVPLDVYEHGLAELWRHEGRQYALPVDWDTVALVVNLDHARAAGIDAAELRQLNWNPRDGGSFDRVLQRLTVDVQGRRGHETGFDARRVARYGFQNPGHGGMMGQTQWSPFAVSAGWRFQARPWDGALRYDDPVLADTLRWFASLPRRGLSAAPEYTAGLGADAMFISGRVAMIPAGSWMIGHFARAARFSHAWVPLPVGPSGRRATMRNGLGVSIWSGSRNAEEAWAWVRHVGSMQCQQRVAEAGVVYPAIKGLAEVALRAQARMGIDARVFLEAGPDEIYPPPVALRAAEVNDMAGVAMERILSGRAAPEVELPDLARRVRAVTGRP